MTLETPHLCGHRTGDRSASGEKDNETLGRHHPRDTPEQNVSCIARHVSDRCPNGFLEGGRPPRRCAETFTSTVPSRPRGFVIGVPPATADALRLSGGSGPPLGARLAASAPASAPPPLEAPRQSPLGRREDDSWLEASRPLPWHASWSCALPLVSKTMCRCLVLSHTRG